MTLSPLEIAAGLVLGEDPRPRPRVDTPPGEMPRAALERVIRPALVRSPCLVSFSGGRDSSAVLAVATALARREGLPLPIPATNRFPEGPGTDEREWQERVVSHLGLEDWVRIEVRDELDCVGPIATRALRRHGLLWPCNAHFHVPLFEAAKGGSLLTGVGGDELLGTSSWGRQRAVLLRQARPERRDVLRLALVLAPRAARRVQIRRRLPRVWAWLRPDAEQAVLDSLADTAAGEPARWARRFAWWAAQRYLRVGTASLALLGADSDVEVVHPLCHPAFGAALGRLPRRERFEERSAAMRFLFCDVLPPESLTRPTKARFDEAFWREPSRALVAEWEGEGVDPDLVDLERLRAEWRSPQPDARSFTLLQAVRLARERGSPHRGVEQPVGGAV